MSVCSGQSVVKFQHKFPLFYLRYWGWWSGDHLNQILLIEEKYKNHCWDHHYKEEEFIFGFIDKDTVSIRLLSSSQI